MIPLPQKSYPILVNQTRAVRFVLAGCGGTGSFMADNLSRLAFVLKAEGWRAELAFVDPDIVELKNVGRQKFCQAEIGRPKALTLAERFAYAYGLDIAALPEPFSSRAMDSGWRGTQIVIGAVDTPAARQSIAKAVKGAWWLDCGNNYHSGQLILGNSKGLTINDFGQCTHLPYPHIAEPDLIKPMTIPQPELSCADALQANLQSLTINTMMAAWGMEMLHRLLMGTLDYSRVDVNLEDGIARIQRITH